MNFSLNICKILYNLCLLIELIFYESSAMISIVNNERNENYAVYH